MNKVEFSADTGAPRIIIQANPSWDAWAEIAEAVWVTALEGGCNYWIDRVEFNRDHVDWNFGSDTPDIKSGTDLIKNIPLKIYHNADDWESGESEITEGMSFDVITVGINNLPPEIKLSIMDPYTCDIDADIADQIVQTGLFGSAVYG
tara:strand:- start:688 stop:1131 length:444 start_codon:yes stop_codon:yes gene_type:complete